MKTTFSTQVKVSICVCAMAMHVLIVVLFYNLYCGFPLLKKKLLKMIQGVLTLMKVKNLAKAESQAKMASLEKVENQVILKME